MACGRYKVADETCSIMHSEEPSFVDTKGCILPVGHDGPHEFIDATTGTVWRWETNLECTCEWCMQYQGDYCTTYWRKADDERLAAAEAEFASWITALGVPEGGNG